MLLKYATMLGLLGVLISVVMGVVGMANNFIYAQENPGASMVGGWNALLAAAIAAAGWIAPLRVGRISGGVTLIAAGCCQYLLVQPPLAAPLLAIAGLMVLVAPRTAPQSPESNTGG